MMYDPALQWPVLSLLEHWGSLPYSDLERMLDAFHRPKLKMELLRDLEAEGLVSIRWVGDEYVVELTPRGRGRVAGRGPVPAPPPREPEA